MSLETDQQALDAAKENEFIIVEIYNIELNDGRILYLTTNNKNVTWNNNDYLAFPMTRKVTNQDGGGSVGENIITLGDVDNKLTKEVLNNYDVVKNAFVTIFQQRVSIDGSVQLGFRQVFRGRIKSVSFTIGIISFTIVVPYSDPQKPINDKKWGETEGMIDAARKTI